jgi:hypothetical protein
MILALRGAKNMTAYPAKAGVSQTEFAAPSRRLCQFCCKIKYFEFCRSLAFGLLHKFDTFLHYRVRLPLTQVHLGI